jgi:hypothetical protein
MSALQEKMARLDAMLDRRISEEEDKDRLAAARRADAVRERQRANFEARREVAARYDDAFRSFGTTVPEAADDEAVEADRRRLFNRMARKLAPSHELADLRADDVSSSTVGYNHFESEIIKAAIAEGERPSVANLPDTGELVQRLRVDPETNERSINWYGRESFVKQMSRGGHRVLRIIDPKSRSVLWGAPFSKAE